MRRALIGYHNETGVDRGEIKVLGNRVEHVNDAAAA